MIYDNNYTEEKAENNEELSSDEKIDVKIPGEENATNEKNKNVIEIDYVFMHPFLFQIVLDLKKKKKKNLVIVFPELVSKKLLFR